LTKNPLIYSVSYFNLEELGALFGGTRPTKPPAATGLCIPSQRLKSTGLTYLNRKGLAKDLMGQLLNQLCVLC